MNNDKKDIDEKILQIMKLEPYLFYSLLNESIKKELNDITKDFNINHCYNCHKDFIKGISKKCIKKEYCIIHGLNDKVWWSEDIIDCSCAENKYQNNNCKYFDMNNICISIDDFKINIINVNIFKEWLLKILGMKYLEYNYISKEEIIERFKLKFEEYFSLKMNRLSDCNNKDCINLLNYIINLINIYY